MAQIKWKLADVLEMHNLTAYRVAQEAGGLKRVSAVYRMARRGDEPKRVDLDVLTDVLMALRKLTEIDIRLSDVLELHLEPEEDNLLVF
jgi:hypothetical protein